MERKTNLSERELDDLFEIIKANMEQLGIKVREEDKRIWCFNLCNLLKNPNFYFYEIILNNKIEGFVEVLHNNKNNVYTVSEVQLSEKVKHTKIILKIIKYLFDCEELKNAEEISFSILKQNLMSNKTFSHLGGKLVENNERKNYYSLSREKVKQYLDRLFKIQ